jgi:syntaxin 16
LSIQPFFTSVHFRLQTKEERDLFAFDQQYPHSDRSNGQIAGSMSTRSSTPTNAAGASSQIASSHLGVTRSRTLLFQSYRDSVLRESTSRFSSYENGFASSLSPTGKGKRKAGTYFDASGELQEENDRLLDGGAAQYPPSASHSVDMSALPPRWVDVSDEVESILTGLTPKIAHLDRLHAKHVLPGFVDRSGEEREIEKETTAITKEFRKCSRLIAALSNNTQALARSGKASKREIAMAQNVQTALATRVQDISGTFRRKQSNYMQRLRGHEIRHQDLHSSSSMSRTGSASASIVRDSEWAVQEDMELVSDIRLKKVNT